MHGLVCNNQGDPLGWANYRPFGPTSDKTVILKLNKHNHLRNLPCKMSEIRRLITNGRLVCILRFGFQVNFLAGGNSGERVERWSQIVTT